MMNVGSETLDSVDSFELQLIALLTKQPRRMFVSLALSLVLIAGMAARTTPLRWVVIWLAFSISVMTLRVVVQSPARLSSLTHRARLRMTVALVALSGIAHGLSLCFFPAMSAFEQAVLSMMLVGLAAGSVATAVGYRPIFLAYIIPTLGPLAVLWAVTPALREVGWVHGLMPILIVLFALVLNGLARDTYRMLRDSYEIRLERSALNRDLRTALESAESANRAKTRFLASASHDLRQPMQTLSLFAAALSMRPLDARSKEIVSDINEALHDLTSELDALLDVSKLDAGTIKPQVESFALLPLLQRISELFKVSAQEKFLTLSVVCADDIWVSTDRKLLERILRNLVENAIKYTDSGCVSVEATRSDYEKVTVSVIDSGYGIGEGEREHIFEEFYQIENPERDRRRGLGLGLAIVRRLVNLLHLSLTMSSTLGEGTQFNVVLPTASDPAVEPSPRDELLSSPTQAIRVLVIDDEDSVRRGMQALLEQTGSSVELASGTEQALDIIRTRRIDLLIADYRLRGDDDGLKAIKILRCVQPDLPALLITGETAPDRLRETQDAGIAVIHKPVMPQTLLKQIAKITRAHTRNESDEQGTRGIAG